MTQICGACGSGEVKRATRSLKYTYKGRVVSIPRVTGDFCGHCDEVSMDLDQAQRVNALCAEFEKSVNSIGGNPDFIRNVRKKLKLDQREAATIFGGGANAFSRYETGKAQPPVALVKLLQVLDRHPKLLAEVRGG